MAKKDREYIEDEDFSSDDLDVYKPTGIEQKTLEVDEEAYTLLEYIDLVWPSMTLDTAGSKVILGTYPGDNESKPEIIEVDIKEIEEENVEFKRASSEEAFNKVRINNGIFAVSDNYLVKYDSNYEKKAKVEGKYRYGLHLSEYVIVGCEEGDVEIYDYDLNLIKRFSASEAPVECVAFENGKIFVGSLDGKLRIFDFEGILVQEFESKSEINSLDVKNGKLVFGDDDGLVHLVNVESNDHQIISWHSSPISFVRWYQEDIFVTGSDEQVCMWDISLEDEVEEGIPKNLLFVHQGQKFYKDCAFFEDKIAVTSEDGLCIFSPISLKPELIED